MKTARAWGVTSEGWYKVNRWARAMMVATQRADSKIELAMHEDREKAIPNV